MTDQRRTIGILGGMGPVATAEFFHRILALCELEHGAVQDGDYPPILVYSMSLKGSSESGIRDAKLLEHEFVEGITRLHRAGCDFVVIPCNTAHHFVQRLRKDVSTPILSIIDLAADEAKAKGITRVGLLASESTYEHGVYRRPLAARGLTCVSPLLSEKKMLTEIVLHIMAGRKVAEDRGVLRKIVRRMVKVDGIQGVIVGCTELSLVLPAGRYPVRAVDALDVLAEASVKAAYGGEVLPSVRRPIAA